MVVATVAEAVKETVVVAENGDQPKMKEVLDTETETETEMKIEIELAT